MDIGFQLSFTESFNIVTADFVRSRVPIIVGRDIEWMSSFAKCDPNSTDEIVDKIEKNLQYREYVEDLNLTSLQKYNEESLEIWREYFFNHTHC